MKPCTKCRQVKDLSEFHKDNSRHDGKCARCRACVLIEKRAYYEANKHKILLRMASWRAANPNYYRSWRDAQE